jgi:hypothetical protein
MWHVIKKTGKNFVEDKKTAMFATNFRFQGH